MSPSGEKTGREYWESLHAVQKKVSLPSKLSVGSRNLHRLFRKIIRPQMRVLEIGCAPGRHLAYIGKHLGAHTAGLDFSRIGIENTRALFNKLGIPCDLRCENVFSTTFPPKDFDVVYSVGVVEHFDDPADMIRRHVNLTRRGGVSLVIVPNYGGIYGRLQRYLDPENLKIHNTSIMSLSAMKSLVSEMDGVEAVSFHFGRMNPWLLHFQNRLPRFLSATATQCINLMGLIQPMDIAYVCPILALQIRVA